MIKKPIEEYTADELVSTKATAVEQEFTLTGYRTDDYFDVSVSDNIMLTKMKKLMKASPDRCKLTNISFDTEGNPTCYFFRISKKCIGFRTKEIKRDRALSEEQRKALAERLATYWKNKKV